MHCAFLLLCASAAVADDALERLPIWSSGIVTEAGGPKELVVTERGKLGEPRDRYATHIVAPDLTVFRATAPSGCALLILPGGGYQRVVMDKEGYESARWFAAHGIASFVLRYRLPGEYARPRPRLPLHDAMRALRFVREWVDEHGGDAQCVGVLGFSAGGHLAGLLATATEADDYAPQDAVDRRSARPDFAVLMYPVVSMRAPLAHGGSRERLLGPSPSAQASSRWSVQERVMARTPPVFLLHAADDPAVDPGNTFALYRALGTAGIRAELHVFAKGGHGFGIRGAAGLPVAAWPELALRWITHVAPHSNPAPVSAVRAP